MIQKGYIARMGKMKMEVEESLWIEFIWLKTGTGRGALGTRQ